VKLLRCDRGSPASDHLDLVRGLTAITVVTGHVRAMLFVDLASLGTPSGPERLFYAATAFGHEAVMVFFVLSGFFVGGGVLGAARRDWEWTPYLVNRFTRIYVVLLPGLALTAAWDSVGYAADPGAYCESSAALNYDAHARLSAGVLLGNCTQLQTVLVPTFGSNGPLWSLANEAWYYLMFPALTLPFLRGRGWGVRVLYLAAGLGLAGTLLRPLALYFLVWCFGAAVALLPRLRLEGFWAAAAAASGAGSVLVALGATRLVAAVPGDFAVGLATTWLVYALIISADALPAPAAYGRFARRLAGFSFTLYVVHMPAVVACRAVLLPGRRLTLTPSSAALFCLVVVAVLVYAIAVARVTEARTDEVRRWLSARLARPRRGAA